jgi:hypothetical protein
VEAVGTRPERVAHGQQQWPGERNGRTRERRPQGPEYRRPRDAVLSQARPLLEAQDRGLGLDAERPVERAGGKAVPGEQELERSHVPP